MWILVVMIYLAQDEVNVLGGGGNGEDNYQLKQPQMVMEMQEFNNKERCEAASRELEANFLSLNKKAKYAMYCQQK